MRLVLQIDAKKVCQELASDAEGMLRHHVVRRAVACAQQIAHGLQDPGVLALMSFQRFDAVAAQRGLFGREMSGGVVQHGGKVRHDGLASGSPLEQMDQLVHGDDEASVLRVDRFIADAEGINPVDRRDSCIDVNLADFFSEAIPMPLPPTRGSPAAQDKIATLTRR
jgi:hypothetical protein